MQQNDFKGLIHSTMTAIIAGIVISVVGILVFEYSSNSYKTDLILKQENQNQQDQLISNEEYPVFSYHISNEIIYSSDNNFEISSNSINKAPTKSKKKITALAYSVENLTDDKVVLQNNQYKLLPMASITKLVTAVIAKKFMDQDQLIDITPQMVATYGNEARFRIGEKMTVSELLYPLLMVSSNDASEALAMSYPKGRKEFIKEMNNWTNSIGAYRTYFADPSGLSSGNVSTANDLMIITKWIMKNDIDIINITSNKIKNLRTHTWTNPTHFLNLSIYLGGKNGYTVQANRTGVSIFQIGKSKKVFVVVLLGSSSRDIDTLDLLDEAVL